MGVDHHDRESGTHDRQHRAQLMIQAAELEEMNPGEVLTLTGAIHQGIVEREAYTLVLAAHWADLHCPDSLDERVVRRDGDGQVIPGTERSFLFGGDGTPQVLEFAPIAFGNSMGLSAGQGRALIADALDLRHRFPQLWCRTCLGEVPAWKARKVAAAARHLSQDAAGLVDADVVDVITRKAWSPFLTILAGRIIAADPEAAQERAERAAKRRFVETSPSNEYGLKGIHAQAEAGDVLRFKAQVDRLAKILAAHGDTESAEVRRSKAMMILANPVLAAALIASSEGVDMAEFDLEDEDLDGIVGRDRDGWHIPNYRPDRQPARDADTPPADPDADPPPPDDPEHPPPPPVPPAPLAPADEAAAPGFWDDEPDQDPESAASEEAASSEEAAASGEAAAPSDAAAAASGEAAASEDASSSSEAPAIDHDPARGEDPVGRESQTSHDSSDSEDDPSDGSESSGSSTRPAEGPTSPARRSPNRSSSGHPEAFQRPQVRTLDRPLFGSGGIAADLDHVCNDHGESSASTSPTTVEPADFGDHRRDPQNGGHDQTSHDQRSHDQTSHHCQDRAPESATGPWGRTPPDPSPGESSAHHHYAGTADPSAPETSAHDQETSPHGQPPSVQSHPDPAPAPADSPPPPELDEPGHSPRLSGISAAKAMLEVIARSGINVSKIGPSLVIYHHYAHETLTNGNGVLRLDDIGPTTLQHLKDFLTPLTRIIVKPVIDLNTTLMPVDGYEIPAKLREHHQLQHPTDMAPWASTVSPRLEIDHTLAYHHHNGPAGQTRPSNTAPLTKLSHRAKTHGDHLPRQPRPGTLVWHNPHGHIMITDHTGTHNLGADIFAQAIWQIANRLNAELKNPDDIQHIENLNIDQMLNDLPRYSGIIEQRHLERDAAERRWGHLWDEQEQRNTTEDEHRNDLHTIEHLDRLANDENYADWYHQALEDTNPPLAA